MGVAIRLGPASLVGGGASRCFVVGGRRVAVFRSETGWVAVDDECPHAGAPLSDGWLEDGCVVCPWHGARFDAATGEALTPPAVEPVRVFSLRQEGDDLVLDWPDDLPEGAEWPAKPENP